MTSVNKEDSGKSDWWGKLFSPEKTMDLAMAGMGGIGKAGMAKEDREYPEKIARQNEKEWMAHDARAGGTGGMLTLGRDYPSQR